MRKITVLTGHLTKKDKNVVKHFIENDLKEGRVGRSDYYLSLDKETYTLKQQTKDKGLIRCPGDKLRLSTYTSTFTIK